LSALKLARPPTAKNIRLPLPGRAARIALACFVGRVATLQAHEDPFTSTARASNPEDLP